MDIPYDLLLFGGVGLLWFGMAGYLGYLAWRFVRAYERRGGEPERLEALSARVRLLEEALVGVEARVAESAEAQRFATELLLGRGAGRAS